MRISDWSSDVCSSDLEITGQIDGIQQATHEAVSAIQSIGGTIRQIDEIAATIASAVDEQGAATQEIARNVQEASAGTADVSSNISGVPEASAAPGAAAEQVPGAASAFSHNRKRAVQGT